MSRVRCTRESVRALLLVFAILLSTFAGVAAPALASSSSAPAGMVGVENSNIDDIRDSSRVGAVSSSDLEGAVYTSEYAATTEIDIVTESQADEIAGGAAPAAVAGERVCGSPAGQQSPAIDCGDAFSLAITDDVNHEGRRVAIRADAVKKALGYVPKFLTIRNSETSEKWEAPTTVRDGWLIVDAEHFSSNSVTWDGTIRINDKPATNNTQHTYNITDKDSVRNFNINVTGVETSETELVLGENVGPSSSQSVSVGGNLDPTGPSANNRPEITVEGPFTETEGSVSGSTIDGSRYTVVDGKYAYVAGYNSDTLAVVDITDRQNPSIVGSVSNSTIMADPAQVAKDGNYVYVTGTGSESVVAIDVSTPSTPTIVDHVTSSSHLTGAAGITIDGNYAYVTSYFDSKVVSVDISTPSSMNIAANFSDTSISGPRSIEANTTADELYLVSQDNDGVVTLDSSSPTALSKLGSVTDSTAMDGPWGMQLGPDGNYAYVTAKNSNSTASIDISAPSTPTVADYVVSDTQLANLRFAGLNKSKLYVAARDSDAVTIVDTSSPTALTITSSLSTPFSGPSDPTVAGGTVYVTDSSSDSFDTIVEPERVSSLSVSDGQTNSASFGDVPIGATETREFNVSVDATSLSWSGSGGTFDYTLNMTERTTSEDITIEVNGNPTSYSGKLSPGSTKSLPTNTSWVVEGSNKVSITTNPSIGSDAPTPEVEVLYRHDATHKQTVNYSAEEWTDRYNVSKKFASDRSQASLTIPYETTVVAMRDLEARINESGGWSSVSTSNYQLSGNDLTVDVDGVYGGEIPAGTTVEVRANGSKVKTHNVTLTVVDATDADKKLNSKIRIDSISTGAYIGVGPTDVGTRVHHTTSESWDSPSEYVIIESDGSQQLYLPNAGSGQTARVTHLDTDVTVSSGDVRVEVKRGGVEPKLNIDPGPGGSGDSIEIVHYATKSGTTYLLEEISGDENTLIDSEVAQSPVTLHADDSDRLLGIFAGTDSGSSDSSGGSDGGAGVGGITVGSSLFVTLAVALLAGVWFLSQEYGNGRVSTRTFLLLAAGIVAVFGLEVLSGALVNGVVSILATFFAGATQAWPLIILVGGAIAILWLRNRGKPNTVNRLIFRGGK